MWYGAVGKIFVDTNVHSTSTHHTPQMHGIGAIIPCNEYFFSLSKITHAEFGNRSITAQSNYLLP